MIFITKYRHHRILWKIDEENEAKDTNSKFITAGHLLAGGTFVLIAPFLSTYFGTKASIELAQAVEADME